MSHWAEKFRDDKIQRIFELRAKGYRISRIALEFGVHAMTIRTILRREVYKEVVIPEHILQKVESQSSSSVTTVEEKFWQVMDTLECDENENGCWFVNPSSPNITFTPPLGRPSFSHKGVRYLARMILKFINKADIALGVYDDGNVVRHTCDMPQCICPDHLILGTISENMQDMSRRGRVKNQKVFVKHAEQVWRLKRYEGLRNIDIARRLEIPQAAVSAILRGRTFKYVDPDEVAPLPRPGS